MTICRTDLSEPGSAVLSAARQYVFVAVLTSGNLPLFVGARAFVIVAIKARVRLT